MLPFTRFPSVVMREHGTYRRVGSGKDERYDLQMRGWINGDQFMQFRFIGATLDLRVYTNISFDLRFDPASARIMRRGRQLGIYRGVGFVQTFILRPEDAVQHPVKGLQAVGADLGQHIPAAIGGMQAVHCGLTAQRLDDRGRPGALHRNGRPGADAVRLYEFVRDPEVTRFLAIDPPTGPDDTRFFIEKCHERRNQGTEYVFVIADVFSDEPMGIICLRHIDPAMRTAQIGTWLARDRWGSGANAEAKRLLLDFAFDRLRLHRVEARIAVGIARSMRAFERLGAAREGILRESFYKDGKYHDQHLYVILEQEWRARPKRDGR